MRRQVGQIPTLIYTSAEAGSARSNKLPACLLSKKRMNALMLSVANDFFQPYCFRDIIFHIVRRDTALMNPFHNAEKS